MEVARAACALYAGIASDQVGRGSGANVLNDLPVHFVDRGHHLADELIHLADLIHPRLQLLHFCWVLADGVRDLPTDHLVHQIGVG